MKISALLIEDDFDLALTVVEYLELEGIVCDHASNGRAGLNLAQTNSYDVLLLDIMLPHMNGLNLCEAVRNEGLDTPIIMLTARDTLNDKIAGFNAGADDYLIKPFAMPELVMRIRALARRRSGQARLFSVSDLRMDLDKRKAFRGDRQLQLTPTCWTILEILMRDSPCVVPRRKLEWAIWGEESPGSNSLKVHIHKLRQQVDQAPAPPLIVTVPGHGYSLQGYDEAND